MTTSSGRVLSLLSAALLPLAAVTAPSGVLAQEKVNIYSYREPGLIDPLLKAFTARTGIQTNVVFANAGLNERLAAEGVNSPADLLFTVDAGRLSEAKEAGLTQAVAAAVADRRDSRELPRSRQPLVRPDDARPRGLCAQGTASSRTPSPTRNWPTRNGRARSASAPASTSTIPRCWRRSSPTRARPRPKHGPMERQGQSRAQARGRRPRAGARRHRPACAISPSATPTTWRRC